MPITNQTLPVVKLAAPVKWGNEEISEITYRRPIITGHLYELNIQVGSLTWAEQVHLAAKATDLPPAFFKALPVPEMAKISQANMSFLLDSPPTGGN